MNAFFAGRRPVGERIPICDKIVLFLDNRASRGRLFLPKIETDDVPETFLMGSYFSRKTAGDYTAEQLS
jgi:hypothetical protein